MPLKVLFNLRECNYHPFGLTLLLRSWLSQKLPPSPHFHGEEDVQKGSSLVHTGHAILKQDLIGSGYANYNRFYDEARTSQKVIRLSRFKQ